MFQAQDTTWLSAAECPSHMLRSIMNAFHSSLLHLPAMLRTDREHFVDSNTHHHWMLPPSAQTMENVTCACGAVEWNSSLELIAFEEMLLSESFQGLQLNKDKPKSNNHQNPQAQNTSQKSQRVQARFSMYSRNMSASPEGGDEIGQASVLDGFTACINGLQTAVLSANMLLSIGNIISDRY
jgi:hypothetical protein